MPAAASAPYHAPSRAWCSIISTPEEPRWYAPGKRRTTFHGTMPARAVMPFARSASTLRTPFCNETTVASLGNTLASAIAAPAVCADFTVTSTMSASRTAPWSLVVGTRTVKRSPSRSLTVSPPCSSSSTRGRPINVTRAPPAARRPPTQQPIAPAPKIAMRGPGSVCSPWGRPAGLENGSLTRAACAWRHDTARAAGRERTRHPSSRARRARSAPRGHGTRAAAGCCMTSTGGKAGFGIAWLLGIPLPILAIVYLFTRC